jgi:hypothetical protein
MRLNTQGVIRGTRSARQGREGHDTSTPLRRQRSTAHMSSVTAQSRKLPQSCRDFLSQSKLSLASCFLQERVCLSTPAGLSQWLGRGQRKVWPPPKCNCGFQSTAAGACGQVSALKKSHGYFSNYPHFIG